MIRIVMYTKEFEKVKSLLLAKIKDYHIQMYVFVCLFIYEF